uniref:UBX domain-containing protein n=1 Tax=Arion vulgaris TaxID=1028688 RepID=A0A0B7B1K1_9EUPU
MDQVLTGSLVLTVFQGIFIITVTVLSLSWLLIKLKKYYADINTGSHEASEVEGPPALLEHYKFQQSECRQKMQEEHTSKALFYKENILKPQEEAKRLKKENEYIKIFGPMWQTEGSVLGGEEDKLSENGDVTAGRKAARNRKVLEKINRKVADEAAIAAAAKQKQKRIITLPVEPDVDQEAVISVILRTPIGTICQRRFHDSDKIQCLLDFITTQGFSQRRYAISTSYPRMLLNNPDSLLSDYKFGKRVTLNIEEKE